MDSLYLNLAPYLQAGGFLVGFVSGTLLVCKLAEVIRNVMWVLRTDETFVVKLHKSISSRNVASFNKLLRDNHFPFFPGNTPLTRWIGSVSSSAAGRRITRYLFRLPLLIVLVSLSIVLISQDAAEGARMHYLRGALGALVLASIWFKTFHLLLYRYRFGVADNYLLSLSVPDMTSDVTHSLSRRTALQRFIAIILTSIVNTITGYGAVYYTLAAFKDGQIANIDHGLPVWIQALYFSTATFLTVGFGDISAKGPVAQLVVTSEMVLGPLLFIIFITAFSATIPVTDD